MKKLLATLTMAAMFLFSTAALADSNLYVGTDFQHSVTSGTKDTDTLNGGNLHLGGNVNKNLAVELGVARSVVAKVGTAKVNVTETTVDAIGILPVSQLSGLDALGTVGVAYNDQKVGPTVGAGLQYHLTKQISVRALAKYEDVKFDQIGADHDVKYTAGVNYAF